MSKRNRTTSIVLTAAGLGLGLLALTAFGGRRPDDDDDKDDDDGRDDDGRDDDGRDDDGGRDEDGGRDDDGNNNGDRDYAGNKIPNVEPDRLWLDASLCDYSLTKGNWRVGKDWLEKVGIPYAQELADADPDWKTTFTAGDAATYAMIFAQRDRVIREVIKASLEETDPKAIEFCVNNYPWIDIALGTQYGGTMKYATTSRAGTYPSVTYERLLMFQNTPNFGAKAIYDNLEYALEYQNKNGLSPLIFWFQDSWLQGGPYALPPKPGPLLSQ